MHPSALALFALPGLVLGSAGPDHQSLAQHHHSHNRHARRFGGNASREVGQVADTVANATAPEEGEEVHRLVKRGYNGRATFFAPGLGACGGYSSSGDMIVALNAEQYGGGACDGVSKWCFTEISITYGDKTQNAKVVDCCPGCAYGGLDMSPGLFDEFADASVGTFYMVWDAAGDDSGSGSDSGDGQSSSSSHYSSPTSSAYSSSSSSSSSSASSSSVASSTSSAAPSSSSAPVAAAAPTPGVSWALAGGNLDTVNQVVMALGNIVGQFAAQSSQS